jgi:hypothetical protein
VCKAPALRLDKLSPEELDEWNAAIEEYFEWQAMAEEAQRSGTHPAAVYAIGKTLQFRITRASPSTRSA